MGFTEIIGQGRALRMLRGSMRRNRVASSYLFAGPEGVGKKLTATAFAMALNCMEQYDMQNSCGQCPSCKKMLSGSHPDFMLVEPEKGVIKVDQVRRIEEALSFRAYEGRYKVIIVDNADKMNISASNAFLKTLEEPTPDSVLVLVSSIPERLPATVRSRCSRVNFQTLPDELCEKVLGAKAGPTVTRQCMGSPGLAMKEDIEARRDWFMNILQGMLIRGDRPGWKDRAEIEAWLDMAMLFLRDMAVCKLTGSAERMINRDIEDAIARMSGSATVEGIIECYTKLRKLRANMFFNLNKGITWNYTATLFEAAGING